MLIINVTQLNTYVKSIMESDSHLTDVYIKAEISNFKVNYKSGHMYFKLKDEKSVINAVMFSRAANYLKFEPADGLEVIAKASVSIYENEGTYQAYVVDMQPVGVSKTVNTMSDLVDKLEKKGYFSLSSKHLLPEYPKKIGIVTSKTGVVIEDIKDVIQRRYPIAEILLSYSVVQGALAVKSLIESINALDGLCDVIIIARGGGSAEDISAFNNEDLANAIFDCKTPIISAIGHETDVTICDMVADKRAGTPSIAAELATPDSNAILENLQTTKEKSRLLVNNIIDKHKKYLGYIATTPVLRSPLVFLENKEKRLDFIHETMYNLKQQTLKNKYNNLASKAAILVSLNPMSILSRGYGAIFKDDLPITSVEKLKKSDIITVKLQDGSLIATVDDITKGG